MNLDRLAEEYLKTQDLIAASTERKDEMKKMLLDQVEEKGAVDATGHQWLPTGEYLLKRERRVTKGFNEAAARAWAEENGILDEFVTTVTPAPYEVFDRDKLAAYAFQHPEVEPAVKSFNTEDVTWAFSKPIKQKDYQY